MSQTQKVSNRLFTYNEAKLICNSFFGFAYKGAEDDLTGTYNLNTQEAETGGLQD